MHVWSRMFACVSDCCAFLSYFLFLFVVVQKFLSAAGDAAQDKPVVVSKFILNAKEIEFDGVAQDGKILNFSISEHVEVCICVHGVVRRTFLLPLV